MEFHPTVWETLIDFGFKPETLKRIQDNDFSDPSDPFKPSLVKRLNDFISRRGRFERTDENVGGCESASKNCHSLEKRF